MRQILQISKKILNSNNMIKRRLELAFWTFIEMLRNLWMAFIGIFHYATHFKAQEEKKKQQDEHHYFREQSKKKLFKWVTKERAKIKSLIKFIPGKDKHNMCIYNYVSSVLLTAHPKQTLEQVIHLFYTYIHPYLWVYYYSWRDMEKILNSKDPVKKFEGQLEQLKLKYKNMEDLKKRATMVLEVKKKVSLDIRKKETAFKKTRRMQEEHHDQEMLKIQEEILQKRRDDAEKDLAALKESKAANIGNPPGKKKARPNLKSVNP